MLKLRNFHRQKNSGEQAQAIVEFAIVLPILMILLVGILEAGRMIFIYSAVSNASREAARYASAVGLNDAQTSEKYRDCAGIKQVATRSAFFQGNLTITISYDHGPGLAPFDYCTNAIDTGVVINTGAYQYDRATVSVSADYKPMLTLVPLKPRTFTSTSSRTILGIFSLSYQ